MKDIFISIFICIIAMTALEGFAAQERTAAPEKSYPAKNITTLRPQISDILQLRFAGRGIAVDREHWKKAAQKQFTLIEGSRVSDHEISRQAAPGGNGTLTKLFNRLRAAAGASGLGSGGNGFTSTLEFDGGGIEAKLVDGPGIFHATIKEVDPSPGLTLNFAQAGKWLGIKIVSSNSGAKLLLIQKSSGQLSIEETIGNNTRTFKSDSFVKFCSEHRLYARERLIPLLRRLGFSIPITDAGDPRTIEAVLRVLRVMQDEKGAAEARKHIEMLKSDNYKDRQAATKALHENFFVYYPVLVEARDSGSLEPEVKARIDWVFDNSHRQREQIKLFGAVYPFARHKDPAFLAGLLEKVNGEDKQVVITALKKLTGKDLENDGESQGTEAPLII